MDLKIGPLRTSDKPANETADFGPDFTNTPTDTKSPPKVNQQNPPKTATSVFSKLGQNKKVRSPVRKLSREAKDENELSDLERLEGWYHTLGSYAEPFHPKFSLAMHNQANECAIAWFGLAENNDTVRRWILGFIEGGDWGKLIGAHAPIFMAVIPEAVLTRFFLKVTDIFAKRVQQDDSDGEDTPDLVETVGLINRFMR